MPRLLSIYHDARFFAMDVSQQSSEYYSVPLYAVPHCPTESFRPPGSVEIKRRRRTSPQQLGVLESSFAKNPLPDLPMRKQLAQECDMSV